MSRQPTQTESALAECVLPPRPGGLTGIVAGYRYPIALLIASGLFIAGGLIRSQIETRITTGHSPELAPTVVESPPELQPVPASEPQVSAVQQVSAVAGSEESDWLEWADAMSEPATVQTADHEIEIPAREQSAADVQLDPDDIALLESVTRAARGPSLGQPVFEKTEADTYVPAIPELQQHQTGSR